MDGSGSERHCDRCNRKVVNLSLLTESERKTVLADTKGACVAYYRAASGDPVGIDAPGFKITPESALKIAASFTLASALAACSTSPCAKPLPQPNAVAPVQASSPAPAVPRNLDLLTGF